MTTVEVRVNEKPFSILEKMRTENRIVLDVNGTEIELETLPHRTDPSRMLVRVGSRWLMSKRAIEPHGKNVIVWVNERPLRVELSERGPTVHVGVKLVQSHGPITVEAPMSGRIVEVRALPGADAKEGQSLIVLEAMKMENEIAAPRDGRVREVHVKVGSLVRPGDKLVVLD